MELAGNVCLWLGIAPRQANDVIVYIVRARERSERKASLDRSPCLASQELRQHRLQKQYNGMHNKIDQSRISESFRQTIATVSPLQIVSSFFLRLDRNGNRPGCCERDLYGYTEKKGAKLCGTLIVVCVYEVA